MPVETNATPPLPSLSPAAGKPIVAGFNGGAPSSDGGLLALRELEEHLGIARRRAACIDDLRAPDRIRHSLADMLRLRLLMIAAAYEDGTANMVVDGNLFLCDHNSPMGLGIKAPVNEIKQSICLFKRGTLRQALNYLILIFVACIHF